MLEYLASGDITRQGFRVTSGLIFWYVTFEAMWYMYNMRGYTLSSNFTSEGTDADNW